MVSPSINNSNPFQQTHSLLHTSSSTTPTFTSARLTSPKRHLSAASHLSNTLTLPFVTCRTAYDRQDPHSSLTDDIFGPFTPERYRHIPSRTTPACKYLLAIALADGPSVAANLQSSAVLFHQQQGTPDSQSFSKFQHDPFFDDVSAMITQETLSFQNVSDDLNRLKVPQKKKRGSSPSKNRRDSQNGKDMKRTLLDVFLVFDDHNSKVSIDWNENSPGKESQMEKSMAVRETAPLTPWETLRKDLDSSLPARRKRAAELAASKKAKKEKLNLLKSSPLTSDVIILDDHENDNINNNKDQVARLDELKSAGVSQSAFDTTHAFREKRKIPLRSASAKKEKEKEVQKENKESQDADQGKLRSGRTVTERRNATMVNVANKAPVGDKSARERTKVNSPRDVINKRVSFNLSKTNVKTPRRKSAKDTDGKETSGGLKKRRDQNDSHNNRQKELSGSKPSGKVIEPPDDDNEPDYDFDDDGPENTGVGFLDDEGVVQLDIEPPEVDLNMSDRGVPNLTAGNNNTRTRRGQQQDIDNDNDIDKVHVLPQNLFVTNPVTSRSRSRTLKKKSTTASGYPPSLDEEQVEEELRENIANQSSPSRSGRKSQRFVPTINRLMKDSVEEVENVLEAAGGVSLEILDVDVDEILQSGIPAVRGVLRRVVNEQSSVDDVEEFDIDEEISSYYRISRNWDKYTPDHVTSFGTGFLTERLLSGGAWMYHSTDAQEAVGGDVDISGHIDISGHAQGIVRNGNEMGRGMGQMNNVSLAQGLGIGIPDGNIEMGMYRGRGMQSNWLSLDNGLNVPPETRSQVCSAGASIPVSTGGMSSAVGIGMGMKMGGRVGLLGERTTRQHSQVNDASFGMVPIPTGTVTHEHQQQQQVLMNNGRGVHQHEIVDVDELPDMGGGYEASTRRVTRARSMKVVRPTVTLIQERPGKNGGRIQKTTRTAARNEAAISRRAAPEVNEEIINGVHRGIEYRHMNSRQGGNDDDESYKGEDAFNEEEERVEDEGKESDESYDPQMDYDVGSSGYIDGEGEGAEEYYGEGNDGENNIDLDVEYGGPVSIIKRKSTSKKGEGKKMKKIARSRHEKASILQRRVCGTTLLREMSMDVKKLVYRWADRDRAWFDADKDFMELRVVERGIRCDHCDRKLGNTDGVCRESILIKLWKDMSWRKVRRLGHRINATN